MSISSAREENLPHPINGSGWGSTPRASNSQPRYHSQNQSEIVQQEQEQQHIFTTSNNNNNNHSNRLDDEAMPTNYLIDSEGTDPSYKAASLIHSSDNEHLGLTSSKSTERLRLNENHYTINTVAAFDEETSIETRELGLKDSTGHRGQSTARSVFLIIIGFIHCALSAGILFGWPPIELMLKMEGMYAHKCKESEPRPCPQQTYQLGLMFTFGTVAVNVSQVFSGYILDVFGPKITTMLFSFLLGCGLTLFGFSNDTNFQAFIPAYILMGVGGPPILNSCLHLSNLFPKWTSTIKSVFSGLFGASALVFFGLGFLNETFHLTRRALFLGYLPVIVFVFVSAMIWWPNKAFTISADQMKKVSRSKLESSSPLKQKGFFGQFFSIEFLGMVVLMSLSVVRLNFFASSMVSQLDRRGDAKNHLYSKAFSIISPLGFVGIPIIGFLLDKCGLTTSFIFVNTCQLLFNVIFLIPYLPIQFVTFIVFAVCRPYLYASKYALISNVMGFKNFGKLVGVCNCLIGLFSTTQFGLAALLKDVFGNDALWINLGFVVVGVLCYAYPVFLYFSNRRLESAEATPIANQLSYPEETEEESQ